MNISNPSNGNEMNQSYRKKDRIVEKMLAKNKKQVNSNSLGCFVRVRSDITQLAMMAKKTSMRKMILMNSSAGLSHTLHLAMKRAWNCMKDKTMDRRIVKGAKIQETMSNDL